MDGRKGVNTPKVVILITSSAHQFYFILLKLKNVSSFVFIDWDIKVMALNCTEALKGDAVMTNHNIEMPVEPIWQRFLKSVILG